MTRRAEGVLTLAAGALGMVAGAFAIAQGIALSPRLISSLWQLLLTGLPGAAAPDLSAGLVAGPLLWGVGGVALMLAGSAAIFHGIDVLWRARARDGT